MAEASNFVIRRSDRHEIVLPARFCVSEGHAEEVRVSSRAPQRDGWIEADLIDIAEGGVGLISPLFMPRGCRLLVEIRGLGGGAAPVLLDSPARVRRVQMIDRRPAYMIGLLFEDQSETQRMSLERLLRRITGEDETGAGVRGSEGAPGV
ncbi:MAG: PilZ domain-containing protein [Phycisphaerales bacterium JB040]